MPKNPDPDESIVLDYGVFRQAMIRHFNKDRHIDADERRLIHMFDVPYKPHKQRHAFRRAIDALMRNGLTRYTAEKAKAANLTLVIKDGYPAEVIPFPGTWHDQDAG